MEREEPLAERPADQLVEGVVAADVLADGEELARRRRTGPRRGGRRWWRTAPGPRAAAPAGWRGARARPRAPAGIGSVTRRVSASSPALPQTPQALVAKKCRSSPASSGSGRSSASSTSTMLVQASPGLDAGLAAQHVLAPLDHPLGEEEAEGQLVVRAGGAHGDGHGAPPPLLDQADLQRLLGRQLVGARLGDAGLHPVDPGAGGARLRETEAHARQLLTDRSPEVRLRDRVLPRPACQDLPEPRPEAEAHDGRRQVEEIGQRRRGPQAGKELPRQPVEEESASSAMAAAPPATIPIRPRAVRGGVKAGRATTQPASRPQAPGSAPTAKASTSVTAPISGSHDAPPGARPLPAAGRPGEDRSQHEPAADVLRQVHAQVEPRHPDQQHDQERRRPRATAAGSGRPRRDRRWRRSASGRWGSRGRGPSAPPPASSPADRSGTAGRCRTAPSGSG